MDREKYNQIELVETIVSKSIPKGKVLEEIKEAKKRRKEEKLKSNGGLNFTTGEARIFKQISEGWGRNKNRQDKIKRIISQLKEYQKQRHISEFSKKFILNLSKVYNKELAERTRYKKVEEIISKAKHTDKKLVNRKRHHFSGSYLTRREILQEYEDFYSFV